jgi:hypothetical protein
LTPVAGVILARFVGNGVRPAAASSVFTIADLPDFPSATTPGGGPVDPSSRVIAVDGARKAQRNMGLKFRDAGVPSLKEFRQAVDENKLVAIRFTPA